MKFYDNNKKEITKQEFIDELEYLIVMLEHIKKCLKSSDKEAENTAIWNFENGVETDFLYHTFERKE